MTSQGCKTLLEAVHALEFPSHEDMLKLPGRYFPDDPTASEWVANFQNREYECMKAIFESKGDPQVIEAQGNILYLLPSMQSAFYIYNFWVQEAADALGASPKQIDNLRHDFMDAIKTGWHGVGEWCI